MRVLVTGATGFVGQALLVRLVTNPGLGLVAVSRRSPSCFPEGVAFAQITNFSGNSSWESVLHNAQVVVHAAARVHVMNDEASDPLTEFRKVNVEGTLSLARQAVTAGVKRFIFISSIKVNGEGTDRGAFFSAESQPAPIDPYAISKYEAEVALKRLADETGLEVVIIRPPLVYGPGVKANFLSMMRWVSMGVPLPLGAIDNRRSLVALDNLVDLIVTCIDHPAAANQTFLVSDGEDLSTSQLLRRIGLALGRPARLLPVPVWLLEVGATLLGRKALAQRLCGSLQVDISKTRELLNWTPPFGVEDSLRKTADSYQSTHRKECRS